MLKENNIQNQSRRSVEQFQGHYILMLNKYDLLLRTRLAIVQY